MKHLSLTKGLYGEEASGVNRWMSFYCNRTNLGSPLYVGLWRPSIFSKSYVLYIDGAMPGGEGPLSLGLLNPVAVSQCEFVPLRYNVGTYAWSS